MQIIILLLIMKKEHAILLEFQTERRTDGSTLTLESPRHTDSNSI